MMPAFLLPERVASEDGQGAVVALDQPHGPRFRLTLGITRILERQSLELQVHGSADGSAWRRLAAFPGKSFCGTYSQNLDLSDHADVRFLRAEWKMRRWNRQDESRPLFGFYVWVEDLYPKALRAAS